MNKIILVLTISIILIASVYAYPMVGGTINIEVKEPFTTGFVLLTENQTCNDTFPIWWPVEILNFSDVEIYPGDSYNTCFRINNSATSAIPYSIVFESECPDTFPNTNYDGIANGNSATIHPLTFEIPLDGEPVEYCDINFYVDRG